MRGRVQGRCVGAFRLWWVRYLLTMDEVGGEARKERITAETPMPAHVVE